jgi:hypothetical protein
MERLILAHSFGDFSTLFIWPVAFGPGRGATLPWERMAEAAAHLMTAQGKEKVREEVKYKYSLQKHTLNDSTFFH